MASFLVSRGLCYKDGGPGPVRPNTRGSIGFKPEKTRRRNSTSASGWGRPRSSRSTRISSTTVGTGSGFRQRRHRQPGRPRNGPGRWAIPGATLPKSVISLGGRIGFKDQGQTACTQISIFDYGETQLIFEVRGLKSKPYMGKGVDNILHFEEGVVNGGKFYPKNGGERRGALAKVEYKRGPGDGHFGNFNHGGSQPAGGGSERRHPRRPLFGSAVPSGQYVVPGRQPDAFQPGTKALAGNVAAADALNAWRSIWQGAQDQARGREAHRRPAS